MKRLTFVVALAVLVVMPVYAHHSFAKFYFENETITIAGEVTQFEYRAPHAWLHVMAPDKNGQMQRFSAEWSNPTRLKRSQVDKDTVKPGDQVIVSGSPGRTAGEYKLHLKGIHRPADGWKWGQVRNSQSD